MNERDMKIVDKIFNELHEVETRGAVVFNANFTQVAKTNLLLLKGLMDIDDEKGLFVVLDRPHQYMSYLLHMHDVSQKNLWYIDTVTHMSGGRRKEEDNVNFLDDPFHIEELFDSFSTHGDLGFEGGFTDIDNIDFILLDNVATMLNYNTTKKVEDFIRMFHDFIKDNPHILGGLTIDPESNPELNEIINDYFDFMIDVEAIKKEALR